MVLPSCQDTGTAVVMGKRGNLVMTDGNDAEHLSHGVYDTYQTSNLRYALEYVCLYGEIDGWMDEWMDLCDCKCGMQIKGNCKC